MARQVITRSHVEHMLGQGATEVVLEADAIITAVAQECARDRGLRLVRQEESGRGSASAGERADDQRSTDQREQVRQAVVAALGHAPEGLDKVLDRVMGA